MRVLLAVHQFMPEYSAGTEVLTYETAKELQGRGHQVAVYAGHPEHENLSDEKRFDFYEYDGIQVARFRHGHIAMGRHSNVMALEYDNPFLAKRFSEYLQDWRPDIVHFFHLQRLSAAAMGACHALGIPTVLTVTDYWLMCPTNQLMLPDHTHCPGPDESGANCLGHLAFLTGSPLTRVLVRLTPRPVWCMLIRLARNRAFPVNTAFEQIRSLSERPGRIRTYLAMAGRILVPTQFMAEMLQGFGLDRHRIRIQPFGIRHRQTAPPRAENADGPLRIGFIGTLYEHKGAHVLVEALRSMTHDVPAKLKIYGDTHQFPGYAEKLTRTAGGDARIEFCGTFPREEVERVLNQFDVLVVPSLWHENTPLVLLHAQATGCPVVGSRVSGILETIKDGVNGLLFQPGDADALAGALTRLAKDRALLSRLAGNALRAKSITEYVDELLHIYQGLLQQEGVV